MKKKKIPAFLSTLNFTLLDHATLLLPVLDSHSFHNSYTLWPLKISTNNSYIDKKNLNTYYTKILTTHCPS